MGRKPLELVDQALVESILKGRDDISAVNVLDIASSKYRALRATKYKDVNKFQSLEELTLWWANQFVKQDGRCCYCQTRILDIQKLIEAGLLKVRKVGRDGSGERGSQFEVERCDSGGNEYSAANCKLTCYYCNNDKSYIFPADDFEKFMGKAKGEYFKHLLSKI